MRDETERGISTVLRMVGWRGKEGRLTVGGAVGGADGEGDVGGDGPKHVLPAVLAILLIQLLLPHQHVHAQALLLQLDLLVLGAHLADLEGQQGVRQLLHRGAPRVVAVHCARPLIAT